ncbi:MAG: cob(I)yrinic acid a,c-diamide adenosyltransferase [Crocinitomicaceae bacterium]|jgi:cob(I)alamin adenosyltransferase|nr:cob(I)yrinic acid a,c-diamide adenosyltransferase [Crocinitomicaceae bacterium]
MKIYTRRGDAGETSLIGGTRVKKSSLRIEAYGTIDELNSYLGVVRDYDIDAIYQEQILEIQDRLFTIGSHLASDPIKAKMQLPDILDEDVTNLENWMDEMDAQLPEMRSFILPGGHLAVSHTHVARCVCRRAERLIVDLMEDAPVLPIIETYVNRLSDYLFVLSRKLTKDLSAVESPWNPRTTK